jgi:predicted GNAT superfamily acetyltransferase
MILRKAETKDFKRILELNEESVQFLSPMDMGKLEHLRSQSEMINVIEVDGIVEAFVLTLRQGKDYDSLSYIWFSDHYDSFLYVDRIVVSEKMQGKGLGQMLYKSVFDHAKKIGVPYIVADIYIDPPNTVSLNFHEKFGFEKVGRIPIPERKKAVSLQVVIL